MGQLLYQDYKVFREALDICSALLETELGYSLSTILWGSASELLNETRYTQPSLFALEYALTQLWFSWGIKPTVLMGHSVGEYAAACVAGVMSLEDSLRLIAARGRLMQALPPGGGMMVVFGSEEDVQPYLTSESSISIAALNGPRNTVLSGPLDKLEILVKHLNTEKRFEYQMLKVSHAFHSSLMEPILSDFYTVAKAIRYSSPKIPFVSNLTGAFVTEEMVNAEYWVRHLRETVQFNEGMQCLHRLGHKVYLEIGPKGTLIGMGKDCIDGEELTCLESTNQRENCQRLLKSLGELYVRGYEVDWQGYYQEKKYQKISLPTYPFQRKRFWRNAMDVVTQKLQLDSNNKRLSITNTLKKKIAELLGMDFMDVKSDIPLLEMGADSIMLVSLIKILEDKYQVKLSIRLLFEELTTVQLLVNFIDKNTKQISEKDIKKPLTMQDSNNETTQLMIGIVDIVSKLLDISPHEARYDVPLLEMGADSITLVSFIKILEEKYEVKLTIRQLFEDLNTIQLIASYIVRQTNILPKPGMLPEDNNVVCANKDIEEHVLSQQDDSLHALMSEMKKLSNRLLEIEHNRVSPIISNQNNSISNRNLDFLHDSSDTIAPPEKRQLTNIQSNYLTDFIKRYNLKTQKSKAHAQLCRVSLCNNRRSSAGFRYETKEVCYPIVAEHSQGAKFWDIDGNKYVDIALGYGAHFFGHNPDFIKLAIKEQLDRGWHLGPEVELTGKSAEMLADFTRMERVLFCNSGTEAVMTAMRIARAAKGRPKIALFTNAYHGHFDGTLVLPMPYKDQPSEPGVHGVTPAMVEDVIVLPFNDPKSFEIIRHHTHELAAVLVEPVQNRRPDLHPKDFLHKLRDITKQNDILLIFDEILVGFRTHIRGAQAWFDVEADIAVYGKIVGGGLPLGVVAGKAQFMDRVDGGMWCYGDDSYPKLRTTYTAGTFCKHPLAMSAVYAVMSKFKETGNFFQETLNAKTADLAKQLNTFFLEQNVPIEMVYFGSFFRFSSQGNLSFIYQPLELDLFFYHLIYHGVYVWEGRTCFLSTAHSSEDINKIKNVVCNAVQDMKSIGFWGEVKSIQHSKKINHHYLSNAIETERGKRDVIAKTNSTIVNIPQVARETVPTQQNSKFSFYYFGNYDAEYDKDKYQLLFEGAKFADENGFEAIWTPERHFHAFGGFSPNPSILSAALARETKNIKIRSSVVLPIHHPVRIAEDWSMIDNLSEGRVGVAFASGWHPNDFVFFPDNWGKHREIMFEQIKQVQALWEGSTIKIKGGAPEPIDIKIYPQPMQKKLPIWIATLGNSDTYQRAGALGANVLTNMIGQDVNEIEERIKIYRASRKANGYDPATGKVTILLHTLVGENNEEVLEKAKLPFCRYLNSSVGLFQQVVKSQNLQVDFNRLSEEDRQYLLLKAYNRYVTSSAIIGTPESCKNRVQKLFDIGIDEIACFVDFGVERDYVKGSFNSLARLKNLFMPNEAYRKVQYKAMAPIVLPVEVGIQKNAYKNILPIDKTEEIIKRECLTEDQELLCLLAEMSQEGSLAYNNSITLKLIGKLNIPVLKKSLLSVIERHEALRTTISVENKLQLIHSLIKIPLNFIDISDLLPNEKKEQVSLLLNEESNKTFNISQELFRTSLIKLDEEEHLFIVTVHHIICDGVSVGIILQDIEAYYSAFSQGKSCQLAPVMQFSEFSAWRLSQTKSANILRQEKYWLRKLNSIDSKLELPVDRSRPSLKTYSGKRSTIKLSKEIYNKLKIFSKKHECTYFMTLLAIYNILLHRLSGQSVFTVGIAFAGRTLLGSEELVGYCSTIFPILSCIRENLDFNSYLKQLRSELLDAYDNQDYPFARLIKKSNKLRDKSRSYFFSVAFNWDRVFIPTMHGLKVEYYQQPISATEYDLMPNIMEINDELIMSWDYNQDLFVSETIESFSDSFMNLLETFLNNSKQDVSKAFLISQNNYNLFFEKWNNTVKAYDYNLLIPTLLDKASKKHADSIAVIYKDKKLTYKELNQTANRIAHTLNEYYQSNTQQFVAILLRTNMYTIPAMVGVMKSGNIYIPINPDFPNARIEQILKDGEINCILTTKDCVENLPVSYLEKTLVLDEKKMKLSSKKTTLTTKLTSNDLAYVIYTAGSTGGPKGVQIRHKSVVNLLSCMQEELELNKNDVFCSVANIATDMVIPDYYLPHSVGASVVMLDKSDRLQPELLSKILNQNNVTVMQASPSLLKMLIDSGWQGKSNLQIISGAEPLPSSLARQLLGKCKVLWNWYGPTETTVWSSFKRVEQTDLEGKFVSIGKPISNTTLYILDKNLQPLPIKVAGELYIGGDGLSIGYLNRPQLNKERFIANPFDTVFKDRILYRTGDRVSYDKFGNIQYQGRADFQVKVRGNRVELNEIESVLRKHEQINEALIIFSENDQSALLTAYIELKKRKDVSKLDVRTYLKSLLPDYMIPNNICFVEKFHYTDNGKIDRTAIPNIVHSVDTNTHMAAFNNTRQKLIAEIWQQVLGHRNFSPQDDFFLVGGNSLLLVQIYAKLKSELNIKFPILELFKYSTIEDIDSFLSKL
jgi:natural product biosynthesis luciferase-like monooxygenase protein/amino acid adenylation domain-containing protein